MKSKKATLILEIETPDGIKKWSIGAFLINHPTNPKVTPKLSLKALGKAMEKTLNGHGKTGIEIYSFVDRKC